MSTGKSEFHCLLSHFCSLTSWNAYNSIVLEQKEFPELVSFYGYLILFSFLSCIWVSVVKDTQHIIFPNIFGLLPFKEQQSLLRLLVTGCVSLRVVVQPKIDGSFSHCLIWHVFRGVRSSNCAVFIHYLTTDVHSWPWDKYVWQINHCLGASHSPHLRWSLWTDPELRLFGQTSSISQYKATIREVFFVFS